MSRIKILTRQATEIGWREFVSLPELDLAIVPAKIDTGARTSAIHAENIKVSATDGHEWVEFMVPDTGEDSTKRVKAKIADRREIRNTSGVMEERVIIITALKLGGIEFEIELSLADRAQMKFPIIIGRSAICGKGIIVNPSRSNLGNRAVEVRRREGV